MRTTAREIRRLVRPISPQLVVCTRCRQPIANHENRLRHIGAAFCEPCARFVGLVDGIERDPRKYGGHEYRGPR